VFDAAGELDERAFERDDGAGEVVHGPVERSELPQHPGGAVDVGQGEASATSQSGTGFMAAV
jgi:hypothetical protein